MEIEKDIPTLEDIEKARERISPYAHKTPVLTCSHLNSVLYFLFSLLLLTSSQTKHLF